MDIRSEVVSETNFHLTLSRREMLVVRNALSLSAEGDAGADPCWDTQLYGYETQGVIRDRLQKQMSEVYHA